MRQLALHEGQFVQCTWHHRETKSNFQMNESWIWNLIQIWTLWKVYFGETLPFLLFVHWKKAATGHKPVQDNRRGWSCCRGVDSLSCFMQTSILTQTSSDLTKKHETSFILEMIHKRSLCWQCSIIVPYIVKIHKEIPVVLFVQHKRMTCCIATSGLRALRQGFGRLIRSDFIHQQRRSWWNLAVFFNFHKWKSLETTLIQLNNLAGWGSSFHA